MKLLARAKINWTLDITGRREDGYHLMDMLMQPVTLADEITLEIADTVTLTCGGSPLLPADEHHLALRAALALQKATGCSKGCAIHVEKHIPVGAGMGGGSADAAGVLYGLNILWELGLSPAALEAIGLTLGADVPFCLRGGLTRTTGIGDVMADQPHAPIHPLCVIQPCEGLSTKEVFTDYHAMPDIVHPATDDALSALLTDDMTAFDKAAGNVMQTVSVQKRPPIEQAIEALRQHGAVTAWMTGSGSAVFGAFNSQADADAACAALKPRWERCWSCATARESIVLL
ncbi:MAG: 4-(cytidine 5'-diphospho)-2-C-methyl-D-erythritol kinase [Clostridia bacterium]|nr:4-(cytidine 5'-diphospho)-2-C-methyl-D-erythritol kinase [Clostridia bacterium]